MYVSVCHSVRDRAAHFVGSIHVPAGKYASQEPSLHVQDSNQRMTLFLTVAETRDLIDVLTGNVEALQEAAGLWSARTRAEREARDDTAVAEPVQS
jgi:hypothetical protein